MALDSAQIHLFRINNIDFVNRQIVNVMIHLLNGDKHPHVVQEFLEQHDIRIDDIFQNDALQIETYSYIFFLINVNREINLIDNMGIKFISEGDPSRIVVVKRSMDDYFEAIKILGEEFSTKLKIKYESTLADVLSGEERLINPEAFLKELEE